MKLSVDRFEGETAVCIDENGQAINIPAHALPPETHEGSLLEKNGESYLLCPDEEEKTRLENYNKAQSLFDE